MMKTKTALIISVIVIALTASFLLVGKNFAKEDNEKQIGLTDVFTLSSTDKLAYVQYKEGKPMLFISDVDGKSTELIDEKAVDYTISYVSFSPDGSRLLYIVNEKDLEYNTSQLYEYSLEDYTSKILLEDENSIITEAIYAPNGESLYLLGAGTFENYSPIAPKNPHNFNIFQYHFSSNQIEQLTQLDVYSLGSLAVSKSGEKLYFVMDDVADDAKPEDFFTSTLQIFELNLTDTSKITKFPTLNQDIHDFTFSPDEKEIVIQAVAVTNNKGIYMYELFSYNLETQKNQQLTYLNEYAGSPIYSSDGSDVYFIVDFKFPSNKSDYVIHRLDRKTNKLTQLKDLSL